MERNVRPLQVPGKPSGGSLVIKRIIAVATIILVAACAARGTREPVEPTLVEVDNRGTLDANIYVVRSSQPIRIGTAYALRTTTLRIPRDLIFGVTTLQFMADPIGAGRLPITENIIVREGDVVRMTIPPG